MPNSNKKGTKGIWNRLHDEEAYPYHTICIGFDQSYKSTGIAVVGKRLNGKIEIIHTESLDYDKRGGTRVKMEYRYRLATRASSLLLKYRCLCNKFVAIAEEIRVYNNGTVSINNHLSWGALLGCIADRLYMRGHIPLFVVDTRTWKTKIVGTNKPSDPEETPKSVDPKKWPTIKYCMEELKIPRKQIKRELSQGTQKYAWAVQKTGIKNEKGVQKFVEHKYWVKCTYNSDICDAICIALFGLQADLTKLNKSP